MLHPPPPCQSFAQLLAPKEGHLWSERVSRANPTHTLDGGRRLDVSQPLLLRLVAERETPLSPPKATQSASTNKERAPPPSHCGGPTPPKSEIRQKLLQGGQEEEEEEHIVQEPPPPPPFLFLPFVFRSSFHFPATCAAKRGRRRKKT